MTEYRHCPVCGDSLESRELDGHKRLVCRACDFVFYRNPAPAAGVAIIENDQVLWVRRKFEPREGLWTLPAGFVEYDEHISQCAIRETSEETGLDVDLQRVLGAYMAMDDPRTQVVLVIYLASRSGGEIVPGDDAADARFFPVDEPPPIAFRAHEQALADIRRLLDRDPS
jgi:8-oxo-dGTP diphosphatase